MSNNNTAVLLIDPYNEFLHPDGKLYHKVATSLALNSTVEHIRELVATARSHHIPIYYCLHQPVHPHTFDGWLHLTDRQSDTRAGGSFQANTFGTEFYKDLEPDLAAGDVVVSKHWSWNSFENTDLEFQLRQRDIGRLVIAGMETSACVESTGRCAFERQFQVTMISDATAAFDERAKEGTVNYVWPLFAKEVITVGAWKKSLEA